ncbi:MAG: GTP-binding protein LepA [Parcubacteria group bacterium Athens0714_16]|nr:MAG: GTP-binding protein LepA [Parcubacteria group bacterium Athens0714_16]
MKNIRNFSIIAHIDHGKSTLADRMLEITNTIEKRKMKEQVLDRMELEREKGITIKMQPVRMDYVAENGEKYIFNLIDTPGHIDFSYEVSRALKAVDGTILLVDATQGVQAQTLTTLRMAQNQKLPIIPVLSKIDSSYARIDDVKGEIMEILGCKNEEILEISGKTGEGVKELLNTIVTKIPSPEEYLEKKDDTQALVFDFEYSNHRGVIVFVRVFGGEIRKNKTLSFKAVNKKFNAQEVGFFSPDMKEKEVLSAGEIGYIVTGIKEPGVASVGDTITLHGSSALALKGYQTPNPVVWASIFPESQNDFTILRQALNLLFLSDSSLSFSEESSGVLGRGFRCGFLGMLHMEIIMERLKREFSLKLIITSPSITYEVENKKGERKLVYSPSLFPSHGDVAFVREPWVDADIITPREHLSPVIQLLQEHESKITNTETFADGRTIIKTEMPLRELMRNFFDELKRVSSGYASLSYDIKEMKTADVVKLEVLIAEELVPAFSKVVSTKRVEEEAKEIVEKLYEYLPRQMFKTKIQASAQGRIISSKTLSAMKKDVTGYLYGGDITRKMKLREKQKRGKKKLLERGKVNIPTKVFFDILKSK